MILAIAALLLHLGPAMDTRTATNVAADIATAATASSTSPQPISAGSPTKPTPNTADPKASPGVTRLTLADSTSDSQSFETLRLPNPAPAKPIRVIAVETTPPRKSWLALSIIQHGAATFDAYTTREAVDAGAREDDPLMRPFAHSPAIYAASQVTPLVLDYAARRMQRSQHALLRHTWWLPQSASTALFIFSGVHNLGVAPAPTR
jgi:hypothetical protein